MLLLDQIVRVPLVQEQKHEVRVLGKARQHGHEAQDGHGWGQRPSVAPGSPATLLGGE